MSPGPLGGVEWPQSTILEIQHTRAILFAPAAVLLGALAPATVSGQGMPSRGEVIRAIELQRQPVFDSVEARFWVFRLLNVVHAETRPWVIRRELLFAPGEPWDTALVRESERNLRALGIFRDVTIRPVATDSGIIAQVRTIDAWTTSGTVGLNTTGSQYAVDLSLQELNLFGTRTAAVIAYRNDPDRSQWGGGFDTPRLLWDRVGLGASIVERSDGRAAAATIRQPFFSLSSRRGGSLTGQYLDNRVLRYAGGSGIPVDSARRRFELLRADGAVALSASPRGYVRVGLTAQLRREDFGPEGSAAAIPRTITAAAGPTIALRRPRFIRMRNVESTDRVEDVDLGLSVQAGLLLAPAAWGYDRTGVGMSLGVGMGQRLPRGFVRMAAGGHALVNADGTDSSAVEAGATLVLQPAPQHLFVAHASGGLLHDPAFGREYDLGLGAGLRAFSAHAFTGDRHYMLNAEYRWLAWPGVLDLATVGVAAFADHVGAWFTGSPRRSGSNVGVGLRVSSIRETGGIWRFDLSRRFGGDRPQAWVFSIGRGFVFGSVH